MMLIFGWLNFGQIKHWDIAITWLANPLVVFAWFFQWADLKRLAFQSSCWAFVVTFAPLVYGPLLNIENVSGFGLGYWLLMLSIAVAAVSNYGVDSEVGSPPQTFP